MDKKDFELLSEKEKREIMSTVGIPANDPTESKEKEPLSLWFILLFAICISWGVLCYTHGASFAGAIPCIFVSFIFGVKDGREEENKSLWKKFNKVIDENLELKFENAVLKKKLSAMEERNQ